MASMKYCDKHNQVGFLKKPEEIKQFWQTATASTLADGTLELRATIDTLEYTITEASVRSKLQLADASGIFMLPNTKIFEGMGNMGYLADVEDLLHLVPNLITKVDSLETELKQTKLTMGNAIVKLRMKKPEDQFIWRIILDINVDPLVSKGDFVILLNLQEKAQEEEIVYILGQTAKNLSKVDSHEVKDISTGFEEVNNGFEKVNTGGLGVSTGSGPVSSALRGQRRKKLTLIIATLEEEEGNCKQVHLDALLAKRIEEEELTKQQKQRKAQNVLGKELPEERFVKKDGRVSKSDERSYLPKKSIARKNKEDLDAYTVKKLSFKEVKKSLIKLVKAEISKKQRIDDKDVSVEEKVTKVKEEEPVIRTGKRKKQKARKGIKVDKSPQGDSETDEEESVEAMNPTPLDTKSNIVANWKIFQQGERSIYQIIRANGADTVYMSFGAMLKDFTREDLIELYRLVMQKYGINRPEDVYDRVLWSDLRTMFDPPLNEDAIWSLPL
ncbi:hypothetical protein Tco_1458592 [Tanacetum coccineum]